MMEYAGGVLDIAFMKKATEISIEYFWGNTTAVIPTTAKLTPKKNRSS